MDGQFEKEETLQCPLDPSHFILRSRMNRHIMKCMKNYNGPKLERCPFNSIHLLIHSDMLNHVHECPDAAINKKVDDFTGNFF